MEYQNRKLKLSAARINIGMTQSEAAKELGISVETLSNYERGKSFPDVPIIKKIEVLYGVPFNDIIFLPDDYDKTVEMI
jgi:transcriptional regulator with XRE-family HTH domain